MLSDVCTALAAALPMSPANAPTSASFTFWFWRVAPKAVAKRSSTPLE